MKILILLLLCLTTIYKVFSIECYVSDGKHEPTIQDCRESLSKVLENQGKSTKIPEDFVFTCYKISEISDTKPFAVKGCMLKGSCRPKNDIVKLMSSLDPTTPKDAIETNHCLECPLSLCNVGTPHSLNVNYGVSCVIVILVAFAFII